MSKLLLLAVSLLLIKLSSCKYEDYRSLEFKVMMVKRVAETKSIKIRKYNRKKRKNKYRTKKITKKNRKIKRTKKNRKKTIKKDSKNKRNQGHGRLVDEKCLGSATIKENENNQKDGAATESSSNRERINRIFSC